MGWLFAWVSSGMGKAGLLLEGLGWFFAWVSSGMGKAGLYLEVLGGLRGGGVGLFLGILGLMRDGGAMLGFCFGSAAWLEFWEGEGVKEGVGEDISVCGRGFVNLSSVLAYSNHEILKGDVMYEGSLEKTAKAVVDSVPRKDIRPRPPPMETMEGWAVGDVAEVFDVGCGRMDSEGFVNLSSVLAYSNHEILKGDVMYEGSLEKTAKAVVDSVPRKDIRPRPPPMETMEGWAVGDVAEVFDVGCGRMDSEVLKCLAFLLLGSWGSQNCELVKFNKPSSLNCHQMTPEFPQLDTRRKTQAGNTCLAAQDNICLQESHIVSSRTLKRASPYCSFHTEGYSGKMRAIENEGECQRVISEFPSPLLKKGKIGGFASKGLKMMMGFAAFLSLKQWPAGIYGRILCQCKAQSLK
nr:hypothetical protein CFP56_40990 [Quercus suber]